MRYAGDNRADCGRNPSGQRGDSPDDPPGVDGLGARDSHAAPDRNASAHCDTAAADGHAAAARQGY
jgi:hypothetical protein